MPVHDLPSRGGVQGQECGQEEGGGGEEVERGQRARAGLGQERAVSHAVSTGER